MQLAHKHESKAAFAVIYPHSNTPTTPVSRETVVDDWPTSQSASISSRRPHEHPGANTPVSPTMMILIVLLSAISMAASSGLAATKPASPNAPHASLLLDLGGTNITDTAPLVLRQAGTEAFSPCGGLEGEWNCMTTTFQRCASGQWSVVLDTAYGTVCEPEGLSYDFQPAFASWFSQTDTTQTVVCTVTAAAAATATSGSTDATSSGGPEPPMTGEAAAQSAIWAMVLGLASTALLFLAM